jgi:hypothetical protein
MNTVCSDADVWSPRARVGSVLCIHQAAAMTPMIAATDSGAV